MINIPSIKYKTTYLLVILILLFTNLQVLAQAPPTNVSTQPSVVSSSQPTPATSPKEIKSTKSPIPQDSQSPISTPQESATPIQSPSPSPAVVFTTKPLFSSGSVIFSGEPIFEIKASANDLTKDERAKIITQRLIDFKISEIDPQSIVIANNLTTSNILVNNKIIVTITNRDAQFANTQRLELATQIQKKIQASIKKYKRETSIQGMSLNVIWAVATTVLFLILLLFIKRIFPKIYTKIEQTSGELIKDIKVNNLVIVSAEHMTSTCLFIAKIIYWAIVLTLLYIYFPLVFSFFPWTRNLGHTLISYVTDPFIRGVYAFIGYIPNIFIILIIGILTNYALKLTKLIFEALEHGDISYPGFHQDWARPTYKIFRFLILAFALVVAFPYLPGSNSPAFRGVSLFLGVLFSLGSTSAVSNIVAGLVMTYMRPFRLGDLVKIADTMGNVIEKTLLVTRIRTTKNEDITIPNAMILSSHIVNYSSSATSDGVCLILHTTVTIGYDVPWRDVHKMLLDSADRTPHLLKSPEPFIFQKSLDDFYVSYELNMYTEVPDKMGLIYSHIHQNIQDIFNEAGIEILSPHYRAPRDGNESTIPASYLPKDYETPTFRVSHLK